jgi:hypothetical protein
MPDGVPQALPVARWQIIPTERVAGAVGFFCLSLAIVFLVYGKWAYDGSRYRLALDYAEEQNSRYGQIPLAQSEALLSLGRARGSHDTYWPTAMPIIITCATSCSMPSRRIGVPRVPAAGARQPAQGRGRGAYRGAEKAGARPAAQDLSGIVLDAPRHRRPRKGERQPELFP